MTILNSKYVTLVLRWQGEDKDKTRTIFCDRIDRLWGKEVAYSQSVFFFPFRVFNQHVSASKALIKNNGVPSPAIWSHKWSEQVSWLELRAGPSCQYQVNKSLSTVWVSIFFESLGIMSWEVNTTNDAINNSYHLTTSTWKNYGYKVSWLNMRCM